ncbi:MAG: HAD family hydrolase [Salinivirgaceae bacterium]|jgi:epoxide hydrolase-like predicted phosphatase|nr:HAD family phosphatase [Bacteroidales bacterium]
MKIKYIIFDLGGVLMDIDFDKTFEAYSKITGNPKEILRDSKLLLDVYLNYESGAITDDEFRSAIRKNLNVDVDDKTIDNAWNALLLDFNSQAISLLHSLKNKYPLYLLSNTNNIHFNHSNQKIAEQNLAESLVSLFDGLFLSYIIGCRKPSEEIYQHVLEQLKCLPQEILFIDDLEPNTIAAEKLGIQTILLTDKNKITELVLNKLN